MHPKISGRLSATSWAPRTSRPAISIAPSISLLKFTESTYHIAVLTNGCESCKHASAEIEVTAEPSPPSHKTKIESPLELTFHPRSCSINRIISRSCATESVAAQICFEVGHVVATVGNLLYSGMH